MCDCYNKFEVCHISPTLSIIFIRYIQVSLCESDDDYACVNTLQTYNKYLLLTLLKYRLTLGSSVQGAHGLDCTACIMGSQVNITLGTYMFVYVFPCCTREVQ
jgi:hypothetical protein